MADEGMALQQVIPPTPQGSPQKRERASVGEVRRQDDTLRITQSGGEQVCWPQLVLSAVVRGDEATLRTYATRARMHAPLSPEGATVFSSLFRAGQFLLQSDERVASWLKKAFSLHEGSPAVLPAVILAALYGKANAIQFLMSLVDPALAATFQPSLDVVTIMFAARGGHLSILQDYHRNGVINVSEVTDGYGSTVVMHAAELGKVVVLRWAVEQGASLTQRNRYGNAAPHFAACHGDVGLIEWMLQMGCSLFATNEDGDDPLLLACRTGKLDAIKYLHKHGCGLDRRDVFGDSPLLSASYHGHIEAMEWLLDHGASVDEKNNSGNTPLLFAAFHGNTTLMQWLLERKATLNIRNADGASPLLLAAQGGHIQVLEFLLARKVSLVDHDHDHFSALLMAASYGHLECVKWLLAHGSSLAEKDADGNDAMLAAAAHGHLAVVRYLHEEKKARLDVRNSNGATALLRAARSKNTQLLEWLVAHGCSFNERDHAGYTVILRAAYSGRLHVLLWMLETGHMSPAYLLHTTIDGRSAAEIAADKGHTHFANAVRFLTGKPVLQMACALRLPVAVTRMLAAGQVPTPACIESAASLPFPEAAPVCPFTLSVITSSMLPWAPARHALFGPSFRWSVTQLLMIVRRLERADHLPVLPLELFFYILEFFARPVPTSDPLAGPPVLFPRFCSITEK